MPDWPGTRGCARPGAGHRHCAPRAGRCSARAWRLAVTVPDSPVADDPVRGRHSTSPARPPRRTARGMTPGCHGPVLSAPQPAGLTSSRPQGRADHRVGVSLIPGRLLPLSPLRRPPTLGAAHARHHTDRLTTRATRGRPCKPRHRRPTSQQRPAGAARHRAQPPTGYGRARRMIATDERLRRRAERARGTVMKGEVLAGGLFTLPVNAIKPYCER
jgi:hypothetical protein